MALPAYVVRHGLPVYPQPVRCGGMTMSLFVLPSNDMAALQSLVDVQLNAPMGQDGRYSAYQHRRSLGARARAPWRLARLARTSRATHSATSGRDALVLMRTWTFTAGRGRGDAARTRGRLRIRSARWPHRQKPGRRRGLPGWSRRGRKSPPRSRAHPGLSRASWRCRGAWATLPCAACWDPRAINRAARRRVLCFARCRSRRARGAPP